MKNKLKAVFVLIFISTLITSSVAKANYSEKVIGKDGKKYALTVVCENEYAFDMLQHGDIIKEMPPLIILMNGERITGTFTYPNLDNSRLGTWDLEWVFTPDDANFYQITGTVKVNVRAADPEPKTEEVTTPSLTALTVQLDTMTTYDINLDNKVSGSTYSWSTDDTEVIDVNPKNGLVKAKKEGKATVSCKITYPDKSTEILTSEITVGYDDNAPLLTETTLDLNPGDIFDINLENKIAKSKYRWVSSDRSIITVNSANGKVTTKATGTAYVTCTITTPTKQVIVLRCDINVTEPAVITE